MNITEFKSGSVSEHRFDVTATTLERKIGRASTLVLPTWEFAQLHNMFDHEEGAFQHYRQQLPDDALAPVVILSDITIASDYQRKGFGKKAVRALLREFRGRGCRTAFLHVGTQGDEYRSGLEKRLRFYTATGWIALTETDSVRNDFAQMGLPVAPIMWHSMPGTLLSENIPEIALTEIDSRNRAS